MTTEQEWLGNIPADRLPRRRSYLMPLLPQLHPSEMFAPPGDTVAPLTPILVTVTEEVTLKYGPRKPVIHWEDVPSFSENTVLRQIIDQALELRALGMEPVFTINGKAVDFNAPIDPHAR